MTNTALRAENSNSRTITFKSKEHEKFYMEYLKKCRYQDVYHQALVYCLGIDRDTRENVNKIYNFKTGCVKTMQFYFSLTTTSLFQTYPFTIFIIYFNITYSPIAPMLPITKNAIYNVKPMLRNSFFAQKLSTQSSSFKINIVFPLKTNINTALITNTICSTVVIAPIGIKSDIITPNKLNAICK